MLRSIMILLLSVSIVTGVHAGWQYELKAPERITSRVVDKNVTTVVVDPRKVSGVDVLDYKAKGVKVYAYLLITEIPMGFDSSAWQDKLFKGEGAAINVLIDSGFDGIVVDGVATYEKTKADAMVRFLRRLKANAVEKKPDFKVYVDKVYARADFRQEVDGVMEKPVVTTRVEPKPVDVSPTPVETVKPDSVETPDVPKVEPSTSSWVSDWWTSVRNWNWPSLKWPF